MSNLYKSGRGLRWWPDANSVNAPEGALLRADNMVPDEEGSLALRAGSKVLYSGLRGPVHSLYTCIIDGKRLRLAGAGDRVYRDGVDFGETFSGAGDFAVGDDAYQVFMARGKTKKKFDGKTFHNWGIKAPETPPTLVAVTAITSTVASFQDSESPAFVVNEGTGSFVSGHDGTANGALKMVPNDVTGRATASKTFAADQDFFNISGSPGGNTDLFDIYVFLEDPRLVDKITLMFGLGTGADPYKDDYYYFDFPIKDAGTVDVKDSGSATASAYSLYADKVQFPLTINEVTDIRRPEDVATVLKRLGRFAGPRSRERRDTAESSPAWTHLSVTRGQFNRIGGTALRDWKTIRAFKVVYTAMPRTTAAVQFDSAVWTGGGNRSLTGRYRVGFRYVRNFRDIYYEVSPISPISEPIDLTQQALQVTIPASVLAGKDPQVNQIWVYLTGGFLDTYYRFAVVAAFINQGMTIDELTNPQGSNFNTARERSRLATWGFTRITGDTSVAADLIFTVRKSELEALIENEKLEPGAVGPPDDAVAVVGPVNNRMYVLTREGRLYISSQDSPSSFSLYQHLDLRRYGDPLWMVRTNGGVFCGMTKDIIRIGGTGDESEDRITADLYPEPANVGNPPVDAAILTDGNSIVFRSADGMMIFNGSALSPVGPGETGLLWRNQDRHNVAALNITYGRFRFATDNHILFLLAPEGESYTPPIHEPEDVSWENLTNVTATGSVLTKDGSKTGFGDMIAEATRFLESGDGYVELTCSEQGTDRFFGFTMASTPTNKNAQMDFAFYLKSETSLEIFEKNLPANLAIGQFNVGDTLRLQVVDGRVQYYWNEALVRTSSTLLQYPLVLDTDINQADATLGPTVLFGNWTLTKQSTNIIWRYDLNKKQYSRCVYPVKMLSLFRDPNGALIAGTDGGEIIELEAGNQDLMTFGTEDVDYEILYPISDGGEPLSRKDALDLQIHADTNSKVGTVEFLKDGAIAAATSVDYSCSGPKVFRSELLDLGTFLRLQLRLTGSTNKFSFHGLNVQYRPRVQQVMVLDTGTISPQGMGRLTWIAEVEIDCISPVDLEMDIYLDDTIRGAPITIPVIPGKRSAYRTEVPKGTKARAPRLVFRTTNPAGSSDPGFEPYRVRIRERGTGVKTDSSFRPVWPVGEAP